MKKITAILLVILTMLMLAGCSTDIDLTDTLEDVVDITDTSEDLTEEDIVNELDSVIETIKTGEFTFDETYSDFANDYYTMLDPYADSFYITEGGVYVLEGIYTSTITIDAGDEDVDLVLVNATISSTSGPAILVLSGDEITISAPPTTVNVIEDTYNHQLIDDEDYNAAIYSKSDLVFNGTGTLTVNGYYNNAINCRDDIKIVDITLNITSIDDGIIGKDYIAVRDAVITADTDGDSLKSTNDEDVSKGFIYIESGTFDLTSGADAIQAENDIIIYDGTFNIDTGDDGIASTGSISIGNGTFTFNCDGDGINSDAEIFIYDGDFTMSVGDDAIHGYDLIQIEGGTINILESYEGIESLTIVINGGTISVISTDDAINATVGGGQIHGPTYVSLGGTLTITGGIIQVSSDGDGVDVNGDAVMTGGYLIVYGPIIDSESTIDYDGSFNISGGLVIGVGSDGMLQALSTTSEQASLVYANGETHDAGSTISLTDSDGNVIVELSALKSFEAVVISSEDMINGNSYTFEVDGDSYDFTINTTVTSLGTGAVSNTEGGRPPRG